MKAAGGAIDMRLRPPLPTWISKAQFNFDPDEMLRQSGFHLPQSARSRSMELLLKEMDDAEVEWGVVMGRQSCEPHGVIPNDEIAECVAKYPTRFVAWAGLDLSQSMDWCLNEIRRCLKLPGFKGVSIEPSVARGPKLMLASDRSLYPIYEECLRLDVPINISLSAFIQTRTKEHSFDLSNPTQIYPVARDFPKLQIHVGHAGWPWVAEMLGVLFTCPNVWLSPDNYMVKRMPMAQEFMKAANTFCAHRSLFGTAYPARPHRELVAAYQEWDWAPGVLQKVLRENALRLMKMQ
jgi:predicted TIM-barrel fold metal-dependent hydrolase